MTKKQQRNLLIIDDSEDDRQLYHRLLKDDAEFAWTVFEAETGEGGLEKYQSEEVHCILLDYSLPSYSGLKVLENLKKHDAYASVVMLTGQGNEAVAVEAMKNGAQDYLIKNNITAESLKRSVHRAIERVDMMHKIDEQQEALRSFSHVLAHDFKAPVRQILSFLGLMQRSLEKKEYDKVPEYYEYVAKSAYSMNALIETLSEYNKLEGRVEFDTVSMQEVIDNILNNLNAIIKETNTQIICGTLPMVYGNSPQLVQLLQNLIGNSIKYCQEETPTVHINAEQKDDVWVFSAKDNGIGMKKEYLERIFEPFKRLHDSSKYAGTGLGLATCKKIIERHNGRIWCDSEEGKGTTFFFIIPKTNQENGQQKLSGAS